MGTLTRPRVVAKQRLADVAMPEEVTLSLLDLTRSAKEHFLSFSVGLGLATLHKLLQEELTRLVGPKGKHQAGRTAYRHGAERRSVTLGGRLVEVERPRARTRDGRELRLPTYEAGLEARSRPNLARRSCGTASCLRSSHTGQMNTEPAARKPSM